MIIITGAVSVVPEHLEVAKQLCVEHSKRSRSEPGCLHHAAHTDLEDAHRIVFLEHWADQAAVDQHFAVSASLDFVSELSAMAAERPTIEIYRATRT